MISYSPFSVYINYLSYRNCYISYCLCARIIQLQLISQVHYINNATSHNNNSYAIHTILIYIEHTHKWNEIPHRQLTLNSYVEQYNFNYSTSY